MVRLVITKNKRDASNLAARIIAYQLKKKSDTSLLISSFPNTFNTYLKLAEWTISEQLAWNDCKIFLTEDSKNNELNENLFSLTNVKDENINFFTQINDEEATRYNHLLNQTKIDLGFVTINDKGEIGHNTISTPFDSETRVENSNITVGLKNLMDCKELVVLGLDTKMDKILQSSRSTVNPASCLFIHPQCLFITDEESATNLKYNELFIFKMYNSICWRNEDPLTVIIFSKGNEVVNMGATMSMLQQQGHNIIVVYQDLTKDILESLVKLKITKYITFTKHEKIIGIIDMIKPDVIFYDIDIPFEDCSWIPREVWKFGGVDVKDADLIIPYDEVTRYQKISTPVWREELDFDKSDAEIVNKILDTKLKYVETFQLLKK